MIREDITCKSSLLEYILYTGLRKAYPSGLMTHIFVSHQEPESYKDGGAESYSTGGRGS